MRGCFFPCSFRNPDSHRPSDPESVADDCRVPVLATFTMATRFARRAATLPSPFPGSRWERPADGVFSISRVLLKQWLKTAKKRSDHVKLHQLSEFVLCQPLRVARAFGKEDLYIARVILFQIVYDSQAKLKGPIGPVFNFVSRQGLRQICFILSYPFHYQGIWGTSIYCPPKASF